MFSSLGGNRQWAFRELDLASEDLAGSAKQLSPDLDEIDFFDSCYLSDEDVVYGANAMFQGLPCESGLKQMALLYRMIPETKEILQLTFEQESD